MKIIDLSCLVERDMAVVGAPATAPVIENLTTLEDGCLVHRFELTSLTGTCLEASAHVFPDGERLDEIALDRLVRPATIFHLGNVEPRQAITAERLQATGAVLTAGDAALISTGWDQMWKTPSYYGDSPYFTLDAIKWLIERDAQIIGADFGRYDCPDRPLEVTRLMLATNRLLLAPLVNVTKITDRRPLLVALPIKFKGVCGSPCRAIIIQN
ncbi:MAG: cyclase family protein [Anaerolineae bacterium]|nr:cyclase family protein [Anaerolineae bacterium]